MVSTPTSTRAPVIGITMGDPLGIGPEVMLRALADPEIRALGRFVVYGSNGLLDLTADSLSLRHDWARVPVDSARRDHELRDPVTVLDFETPESLYRAAHGATRAGGDLSKRFLDAAIEDARRPADDPRAIDAIVTAPICKTSWSMAGVRYPGHTELLAARTRAKTHAMLFHSSRLVVALATAHVPLMEIRNVLTIGRVFEPIDLGARFCAELGIERPRIAVCGLNPHAGEGGLLGDEDGRVIEPAIRAAREAGIDARGPFPADTIFIDAAEGKWDLVVAMYHDQGLIPVKLLGWREAVNVTVGLPIIRTSPDHGTAFDIAGRGRADAGSMSSAIRLAARLATRRIALTGATA